MTSQINPNNIDGAYPVAGQDNNSQGFRDNFTNTKVNFQYASDEISDLQAKAVLKAALTGSTLDNNMNDALLVAAQIQDFSAIKVAASTTSGTVTINYVTSHYQTITTTGSITLAFTPGSWPPVGQYGYLKLQINITNVAHTVTLPGSVTLGVSGLQGYSAGVITFASTGYYEFGFGSYDNGATITIFDLNRALTNFTAADLVIDDLTATGFASVTGNVQGGNLRTAGQVSATGNVTAGNVITGGLVSVTGNVQGGNLRTGGLVSATGNVTGGNIVGFVRPSSGTAAQAPIAMTSGTLITTPTAGTMEYDGVVFYSTPQTLEQRGVIPSEHILVLASDYTANNTAVAQQVFNVGTSGTGTVTLGPSTTYQFEGAYFITRGSGVINHTTSILFNVSSPFTSITYCIDCLSSAGGALGTPQRVYATGPTAVVITAANSITTEQLVITFRGMLRTNLSATVQPQFQYSAAPGGAPTVLKNSYIKFSPVGTSAVTTVGAW